MAGPSFVHLECVVYHRQHPLFEHDDDGDDCSVLFVPPDYVKHDLWMKPTKEKED